MDIEGAFNCISRTAIETAALRHGIPPTIVRWMVGMLTDRRIYTEWMVKRVEGRVSDGYPQGGGDTFTTPVVILVADDLIRILNDSGIFIIGYADDFAFLVGGKCEKVPPDKLMQRLSGVKNWCENKSLRVNPTKTEIVIFTRKYKVRIIIIILLWKKNTVHGGN